MQPRVATITANGTAVTVTTGVPGERGRLTFPGRAGQEVSLMQRDPLGTGLTPVCRGSEVHLLAPDGREVTYENYCHLLGPVRLPSTGAYTIEVRLDGAATGTLMMALYDVPH